MMNAHRVALKRIHKHCADVRNSGVDDILVTFATLTPSREVGGGAGVALPEIMSQGIDSNMRHMYDD